MGSNGSSRAEKTVWKRKMNQRPAKPEEKKQRRRDGEERRGEDVYIETPAVSRKEPTRGGPLRFLRPSPKLLGEPGKPRKE